MSRGLEGLPWALGRKFRSSRGEERAGGTALWAQPRELPGLSFGATFPTETCGFGGTVACPPASQQLDCSAHALQTHQQPVSGTQPGQLLWWRRVASAFLMAPMYGGQGPALRRGAAVLDPPDRVSAQARRCSSWGPALVPLCAPSGSHSFWLLAPPLPRPWEAMSSLIPPTSRHHCIFTGLQEKLS